jgi:hypothetical protein
MHAKWRQANWLWHSAWCWQGAALGEAEHVLLPVGLLAAVEGTVWGTQLSVHMQGGP